MCVYIFDTPVLFKPSVRKIPGHKLRNKYKKQKYIERTLCCCNIFRTENNRNGLRKTLS